MRESSCRAVGTINSEYKNYQGKPEQIRNRSLRNQARLYKMHQGDVEKGDGMDVDHINPLAKGGSNLPSNLRVRNPSSNRSFPRTRGAGLK